MQIYIAHSHKKSLMRWVRLVNNSQKVCFQVYKDIYALLIWHAHRFCKYLFKSKSIDYNIVKTCATFVRRRAVCQRGCYEKGDLSDVDVLCLSFCLSWRVKYPGKFRQTDAVFLMNYGHAFCLSIWDLLVACGSEGVVLASCLSPNVVLFRHCCPIVS